MNLEELRAQEAEARHAVFQDLTFSAHYSSCPADHQRVRNQGPCSCGADAAANQILDELRDAILARRDAEVRALVEAAQLSRALEHTVSCEMQDEEAPCNCGYDALVNTLAPSKSRLRPMSAVSYRKKPVVIEAMQFDGSAAQTDAIIRWAGSPPISMDYDPETNTARSLTIRTLEGDMRADPGDWIIKGVKGEFYPQGR